MGEAVASTVRGVSMQVQTDPTKLFACNSKELRTTEAVGFGVAEAGLLVVVTARLLGAAMAVT
jgi:CHASE1-domain containing sensor protein